MEAQVTAINTQRLDSKFVDSAKNTWFIKIGYERQNDRAIPVSLTVSGEEGIELTQRVVRESPFSKMSWISRSGPVAERHELVRRTGEFRRNNERTPHRGARRIDHEEVELMIKVFMDAYRTGRPTVKTVAKSFGISESAANKRIIMLRKMELLPPSRGNSRKNLRQKPI
jgi:hypothetical protein